MACCITNFNERITKWTKRMDCLGDILLELFLSSAERLMRNIFSSHDRQPYPVGCHFLTSASDRGCGLKGIRPLAFWIADFFSQKGINISWIVCDWWKVIRFQMKTRKMRRWILFKMAPGELRRIFAINLFTVRNSRKILNHRMAVRKYNAAISAL